ncbi:MAG: HAD family hydrolase [Thermoplasmata archaeon]|nr:HAD family hydrolase [Thermoplasmata archaeon]
MSPRFPPPPRLVLFDMDDTLFDHSLTCRAALEAVRSEEPRLRRRSLDELWTEYVRLLDIQPAEVSASPTDYARFRAERFRSLASRCGWTVDANQASELSRRYRELYQRLRRPVPGAPEFVRRVARRVRVGMVTNNERLEQEEKLRFLGLADVIDPLVASAQEQVAKPDPRIFAIALKRADVRPSEAVMVGDSWRNDVLGARSAGVRPVWFNRFAYPRPSRHRADEIRNFRPFSTSEQTLHRGKPAVRDRRA